MPAPRVYRYISVCLGVFVQTVHSQFSGNRADYVWREGEREGKGLDARSPTERYDSLRFPCGLVLRGRGSE